MALADDKKLDVAVTIDGHEGGLNGYSRAMNKFNCTNFYSVKRFKTPDNQTDDSYGMYGYTDISTVTGDDLDWINTLPAGTKWEVRPGYNGVTQAKKYVKITTPQAAGQAFITNWKTLY